MIQNDFTAVVQKVSGGYIAFIEEMPGTGIYGATLEETLSNLQDALTPFFLNMDRQLEEN
ncbi:MAG TPA: type II toxin-antitoxin system HicB family antitoxin [Candidatus Binatia bacterium]|nr:type II toxin-antitoxin system HicB family antitoxin [Candidatus Binatia bacterium]